MITEVMRYDQWREVQLLFSEEHANNDIGMGYWDTSDKGLYTSGASPCIIIAAHNRISKNGLVGHFNSVASDRKAQGSAQTKSERFALALKAVGELGDPTATELWLGGGAPLMNSGEDIVEPDRVYARKVVADHLRKMRVASNLLSVRWSRADHCIDVEMDCESGCLAVHDYPVEELTLQEMRKALSGLWLA